MRLAFATGNKGKLREASEILGEGYELLTPRQLGVDDDVAETGATLAENSMLKADALHERCEINCFADDTGLEVNALGGEPGVRTARYGGGVGHDSQANMSKLLKEMEGKVEREARFHTVVTYLEGERKHVFEGFLYGRIATEKHGEGGFGYDPVFVPDMIPSASGALVPNSASLTLAELSEEDKNRISHRGMALRNLADFLRSQGK